VEKKTKKEKRMAKSPQELPHKAFGWAAKDTSGTLSPFHFSRRLLLFLFFTFLV